MSNRVRRSTAARVLAACSLIVVLAACGSSGSTLQGTPTTSRPEPATGAPPASTRPPVTTAKTLPKPCALVTRAEAEKVVGTPLDAGNEVRDTCTYTGPVTGPLAQVEVFVGDGAKKMLDIDRQLDHEFTVVRGVGDEAHAEDGAIFVRSGTVWVAIRVVLLDDHSTYAARLEEAARVMAARL